MPGVVTRVVPSDSDSGSPLYDSPLYGSSLYTRNVTSGGYVYKERTRTARGLGSQPSRTRLREHGRAFEKDYSS